VGELLGEAVAAAETRVLTNFLHPFSDSLLGLLFIARIQQPPYFSIYRFDSLRSCLNSGESVWRMLYVAMGHGSAGNGMLDGVVP